MPFLDRIDIHVEVPRADVDKLTDDRRGEPSAAIRAREEAARERQRQRFAGTPLVCNADMGPTEARRILKLVRTIADLAGSEHIETPHLAEAIQYRPRRAG